MALDITGVYICTSGEPASSDVYPRTVFGNVFPVFSDDSMGPAQPFSLVAQTNYQAAYGVDFYQATHRPGSTVFCIENGFNTVNVPVAAGAITVASRTGQKSWYSQLRNYILTPSGRIFFMLFEFDGTISDYWLRELTPAGDVRVVKLTQAINGDGGAGVVTGNTLVVRVDPPNAITPFAFVDLSSGAVTTGSTFGGAVGLYESYFQGATSRASLANAIAYAGFPVTNWSHMQRFMRVSKAITPLNFWANYVGTSEKV